MRSELLLGRLGTTAIGPGLWRIALPFPNPLGYSFSYLLRCNEGIVAIDLGWDSDEGWELFRSGVERAGASVESLIGVVVTHAHPDHYGLAARLRGLSNAWIALHPAERAQLAPDQQARQARVDAIEAWLRTNGVPEALLPDMMADRDRLLTELTSQLPDRDLGDEMTIPGTAGQLVAHHTPGHTPGHTIFHDRGRGVVFTGDHLLPRVSANVSVRPTSGADPLGDYLISLGRIPRNEATVAAPGHEWSFDRIGSRIETVEAHHAERLDEVERALAAGAETAWQVARELSWSRPFDSLNPRGRRSALGEAVAHLVRLRETGRARFRDHPERWSPTARE